MTRARISSRDNNWFFFYYYYYGSRLVGKDAGKLGIRQIQQLLDIGQQTVINAV
jgi:hypothetical protein